jgi:hypothetical protein
MCTHDPIVCQGQRRITLRNSPQLRARIRSGEPQGPGKLLRFPHHPRGVPSSDHRLFRRPRSNIRRAPYSTPPKLSPEVFGCGWSPNLISERARGLCQRHGGGRKRWGDEARDRTCIRWYGMLVASLSRSQMLPIHWWDHVCGFAEKEHLTCAEILEKWKVSKINPDERHAMNTFMNALRKWGESGYEGW